MSYVGVESKQGWRLIVVDRDVEGFIRALDKWLSTHPSDELRALRRSAGTN